jgi:hypothetical protein
MSYLVTLLVACLGWVVGFISSVASSYFTDRRKAVHALTSEIESIRSEFSDYARFKEIHADSIPRLKPLVFGAIPFLSRDKQDQARNTWTSYRDLDVKQFYEFGLVALVSKVISKETGEVVITEQEAVDMMLSKLHDALSGIFPWQ